MPSATPSQTTRCVQLRAAIAAVFNSWHGDRAVAYRARNGLDDLAGTAVTVQAMAFGNLGDDSATGVAFTRDPSRATTTFTASFSSTRRAKTSSAARARPTGCHDEMPLWSAAAFRELLALKRELEARYRDMQGLEFTIERGKLFLLQTRTGKRTARAAIRIAADLARARVIDATTAVLRRRPGVARSTPAADLRRRRSAVADRDRPARVARRGRRRARVRRRRRRAPRALGERVILVRPETDAADVGGMFAAAGVLTLTGGMTATPPSRPAAWAGPASSARRHCGSRARRFSSGERRLGVGDTLSLDGAAGHVYAGALPLVEADLAGPFAAIMRQADRRRATRVCALATSDDDLALGERLGADGALIDARLAPRPYASIGAIARRFADRRAMLFAAGPSGATLIRTAAVEANAAAGPARDARRAGRPHAAARLSGGDARAGAAAAPSSRRSPRRATR